MGRMIRKIQRRRDRCNREFTGLTEIIVKNDEGKKVRRAITTYKYTPMNKQQRILAGLVAPKHIHDPRFEGVRRRRTERRT